MSTLHDSTVALDRARAEVTALAVTADGQHAFASDGTQVWLLGGRTVLHAPPIVATAAVERAVWIVARGATGHTLHRFSVEGGPLGPAVELGELGDAVQLTCARTGLRMGVVEGQRALELRERPDGGVAVHPLGPAYRDRRVLLAGRGVLERRGAHLVPPRPSALAPLLLPTAVQSGAVTSAALVLDGALAVVEVEIRGRRQLVVYEVRRATLRGRIEIGDAWMVAWAERRGHVVVQSGELLRVLDVSVGRYVAEYRVEPELRRIGCDANGELLGIDARGERRELGLVNRAAAAPSAAQAETEAESVAVPSPEHSESSTESVAVPSLGHNKTRAESPTVPAATGPAPSMMAEPAAAVAVPVAAAAGTTTGAPGPDGWISLPRAWPRLTAFRQRPAAAPMAPAEVAAYLGDTRGLLAALCRRAIAQRSDTTPRSPSPGEHGLENAGAAGSPLDAARAQEHAARAAHAQWSRRGAPHVELAVELGLSPLGVTILIVAAGPALWGELAAAYGLVADSSARTPCDEHLVAQLLDADPLGRLAIARELDENAPLVRTGLIELGPGRRPFRELIVPDVVVRRLAGDAVAKADPLLGLAARFGELDQPLWVAPGTLDDALATLATADPAGGHARVVIRGRPGTGRTTLAAAFAATAERGLAVIDGISGAGDAAARRLRQQLGAALLRGLLPCVAPGALDDAATRAAIQRALDDHPGPVIVCAAPDEDPPLAAGHLTIALDVPPAAARHGLWLEAAARHGVTLAGGVPREIADRFALGPGAIDQAAAQLGRSAAGTINAATATRAIRRQRQRRIEHIADRVDRLASWEDVVLPAELATGVRALIGRIRNRRAVLERWGMEHVATTGRGVTALLQGGPGTGKTLVAGLIAREVGYELYRIDLSKVVSKWIGETEKNLGTVFDAAEAGEVVLLFDEADALFARRTDVRSSNDRHANLEVNYLLQRLDSFTGVAVLTTNFGTAIDPAFRRRLAMRLEFPLPDEAERARLWRVHLPASLPQRTPALDELAGRYAMSGAYIRNAALRAAFLAADRDQPIDTALLREAIEAEYREAGKIEAIGTLQ